MRQIEAFDPRSTAVRSIHAIDCFIRTRLAQMLVEFALMQPKVTFIRTRDNRTFAALVVTSFQVDTIEAMSSMIVRRSFIVDE